MKNQDLQLVTFEQAVKLGKSGFDWSATHAYVHRGMWKAINIADIDYREKVFQAPTVALALKWMRDVKKVSFQITTDAVFDDTGDYTYQYEVRTYDEDGYDDEVIDSNNIYYSYEQAESALLDELLTLLETK